MTARVRNALSLLKFILDPLWNGPWKYVVFAAVLISTLRPLHDELRIPVTATCPDQLASTCKALYDNCRVAGTVFEPGMPGLGRISNVERCKDRYAIECSICGTPVELDCRTYWERWQKLGPSWIRWLPGGESRWAKMFGSGSKCEYRPATLGFIVPMNHPHHEGG